MVEYSDDAKLGTVDTELKNTLYGCFLSFYNTVLFKTRVFLSKTMYFLNQIKCTRVKFFAF